jgi:hypothetical protein
MSPDSCDCLGSGSDECDTNRYVPPVVTLRAELLAEGFRRRSFLELLTAEQEAIAPGELRTAAVAPPLAHLITIPNPKENHA